MNSIMRREYLQLALNSVKQLEFYADELEDNIIDRSYLEEMKNNIENVQKMYYNYIKQGVINMNTCTQCNKDMNPVEAIISEICNKCAVKNHNDAMGNKHVR